ncbi:hypothetical protein M885DRAFT_532429 [Pelagophyceae sp. CCMP2097]|nr:hypothetical protein M885DRAFT_532429 [Pelagophyceae sp. CCMP2097]
MFPMPFSIGSDGMDGDRFEEMFGMFLPRIARDLPRMAREMEARVASVPVNEPAGRAAIDALLDSHSYIEADKTGLDKSAAELPRGAQTRSRAVGATKRARCDESDHGTCPVCIDDRVEGDASIRMPCCNQRFHRQCILQWFVKESDKCPMCRGALATPLKRGRTAYASLPVAELRQRCAERALDAAKDVDKTQLCALLEAERDSADAAGAERAARRARERVGFTFGGMVGMPISVRMPIFAAQMAVASMAAATARERGMHAAGTAGAAPPPPGRGARQSARTRMGAAAAPPRALPSRTAVFGALAGAPSLNMFGPPPQLVRAMLAHVALAVGGEPSFVHVSQAPGSQFGGLPISMMVARAPGAPPAAPAPSDPRPARGIGRPAGAPRRSQSSNP